MRANSSGEGASHALVSAVRMRREARSTRALNSGAALVAEWGGGERGGEQRQTAVRASAKARARWKG